MPRIYIIPVEMVKVRLYSFPVAHKVRVDSWEVRETNKLGPLGEFSLLGDLLEVFPDRGLILNM